VTHNPLLYYPIKYAYLLDSLSGTNMYLSIFAIDLVVIQCLATVVCFRVA